MKISHVGYSPLSSLRLAALVCLATSGMTASVRAQSTDRFNPKLIWPKSTQTCQITPKCAGTNTSYLWAQEAMDIDLMMAQLREWKVPEDLIKIAVVDTGFDMAGNRSHIADPEFSVDTALSGAGDPSVDEQGHGTAVSGTISGKYGLGSAPNLGLRSFRAVARDASGATSRDLWDNIIRACGDGYKVINLSWGGMLDELNIGFGRDEDNAEIRKDLKKLSEMGCLVVKAAGNAGLRTARTLDFDDNYLRVEATTFSGLAYFSSDGELSAPGQDIFTLASQHSAVKAHQKQERLCGGVPGSFISGTSFSAPFTAGIAGQTYGLLSTSPEFRGFTNPDKIRMLNRVLQAGTINRQVNALKTVTVAKRWMDQRRAGLPSLSDLRTIAALSGATCTTLPTSCRGAKSCDHRQACVRDLRHQSAVCETPSADGVKLLYQASIFYRDYERAIGVLSKMNRTRAIDGDTIVKSAVVLWQGLKPETLTATGTVKAEKHVPLLMDLYAWFGGQTALATESRELMDAIINSSHTITFLGRELRHGGQDLAQQFVRDLEVMQGRQGTPAVRDFLLTLIEKWNRTKTINGETVSPTDAFLASLHITEGLLRSPVLKDHYARTFAALSAAVQNHRAETYLTDPTELDSFLERHREYFSQQLTRFLSAGGPLNPFVLYFLRNPEALPAQSRRDFYNRLIERKIWLVKSFGFTVTNPSLTQWQLNAEDLLQNSSATERDSFKNAFWAANRTSTDEAFWVGITPALRAHIAYSSNPRYFAENPFYSNGFAELIFQRILEVVVEGGPPKLADAGRATRLTTSILRYLVALNIKTDRLETYAESIVDQMIAATKKPADALLKNHLENSFSFVYQVVMAPEFGAKFRSDPRRAQKMEQLKVAIIKAPAHFPSWAPKGVAKW